MYIGDSLLGAPVGEEGTGTLFGGGASLYCRQLDERVPKVCPRGMELKKKKLNYTKLNYTEPKLEVN